MFDKKTRGQKSRETVSLRQRVSEEENSKRALEFLLCDITVEYICFVFQE